MIKCLDLFCGGGGSSCGAELAGCKVLAGIDCWDLAANTFKNNFPGASIYVNLLEKQSPAQILRDVGPIDLILASPECTDHSVAKGAVMRSERSRETAFQVLRYVKKIRPRWVVLENVVRIKQWPRYQELLDGFKALGYYTEEHELNAADFGVAQKRKRLFILFDRQCPPPKHIFRQRGRKPSAASILDPDGTWPVTDLYSAGRAYPTIERAERGFAALGTRQPFLVVYYGSDSVGGWQRLCKPLRTVTTLDRFGLVQRSNGTPTLRMLQVPELRKAMGFPEDFQLTQGSRRDRIKVLGNSVCPPVMANVLWQLVNSNA